MSAEVFRRSIEQPSDRVIVALDGMGWEQATQVMQDVGPYVGMGKANSIAQKLGWINAIDTLALAGVQTMADQKYKDIPQTMQNHLQEITECGPKFVTIFADNSPEALKFAVKGRDMGLTKPDSGLGAILGITVLTSIGEEECISIYGEGTQKKVLQFAHTALETGIDGIVCSGKELSAIRKDSALDDLLTVVPGITPDWAKKAGDQKRVVTPSQAVQSGADFIVIGRAITKPPEGMSNTEAAQKIATELEEA